MFESRLAIAALSTAGAALAQSPISSEPPAARPAPAVQKAEDNIVLGIQRWNEAGNRATAQICPDLAMIAAATGNEAEYRAELRLSKQLVN